MDKEKCGRYIRRKREALGLSKSELAEKLGVSGYDVDCWESGFFPPAELLLPLSDALKINVEELLSGEDLPEKTLSSQPTHSPQTDGISGNVPAQSGDLPLSSVPTREGKAEASSASASPEAKPPKTEKSYYEELHEKMRDVDWENVAVLPSGENGFSDGERRFGKILCVCFLALVLIIQGFRLGGYLTRDRELTLKNYGEYISVSVYPVGEGPIYSELKEYTVAVSAKTDIEDFRITAEVSFYNVRDMINGEIKYIYRDVSLSKSVFAENASVSQNLSFDFDVREGNITIKSVEGRLP